MAVTSVAFSPDNSQIVFGSIDQHVRVWTMVTNALIQLRHGHSLVVACCPSGTLIASGSAGMTVRNWDIA